MRRASVLVAAFAATLAAALSLGAFLAAGPSATGVAQMRVEGGAAAGTPVATAAEPDKPLHSDPLDGEPSRDDPLDGDPQNEDNEAPPDQTQLEIVRSGRPNEEPPTQPAYDKDPATIWTPAPESDETWLWLDLGGDRRLREVRWLAQGSGMVGVAVSRDRQRWRDIDRADVGGGWQGIELRDDARFVRFELLPDADGNLPSLAEIAVYGLDQDASASAEQEAAGNGGERTRNRAPGDTSPPGSAREKRKSGNRSSGRVRISAEPGETRCAGKRERCEARQGQVSVEEDCERAGSCTIDVRADGGTAICDASGPDKAKAGDGEGKRGGNGGDCAAVADGGTVIIGDIDP